VAVEYKITAVQKTPAGVCSLHNNSDTKSCRGGIKQQQGFVCKVASLFSKFETRGQYGLKSLT